MVNGAKNRVWEEVLSNRSDAIQSLNHQGFFEITSQEVNRISKKISGPDFRNLSKFDKREDLPDVFVENELNILPISRKKYLVGHFDEYANLSSAEATSVEKYQVPNLASLLGNSATWNENSWISAGLAANVFDQAFEDSDFIRTITGRMGGGNWQFNISDFQDNHHFTLQLENPQIEIDTVLESPKAIYIIEAKQVKEDNFLIRQLYFPYRKLLSDLKIDNKPIIPVFFEINAASQYARVRIFSFDNDTHYNSIREIRRFEFQLIDRNETETAASLLQYAQSVITHDTVGKLFPQANDMSKVLELMMILKRRPLTKTEIAENFNFDPRQSDYYVKNILMYFGLAEQIDSRFKLTVRGKHIAQQAVGQRNILLAREIISYSLFNHLIQRRILHGRLNKKDIIHEMLIADLGLSISTLERRASTVNAIIEWIMLQILD
ncbi:hypothetical protein EFT43_06800 [Leuconostoc falkenbergense]|uniref:type II restriction enzyme n=1 Tax=Leuconostoc falkenbergense TaxID=2766470 RepID=UPI0016651E56|nr:hypothetical protein [Leuconostoc falkenbergense]MCT4404608.1 hypothetical protein [Leuconostoc falkenbergense]